MKIIYFFLIIICCNGNVFAQPITRTVLFLGNSYTHVNNLPQMISDVAASTGDVLNHTENTPGGYTLQGHSTNTTSLNLLSAGNLDFVVLQEQSQRPAFPISQVLTDVFPYATILDTTFNFYNPCGETVFYMTWGRKNGDASNCVVWPPVCTYEGMDSLLNLRYRMMADSNNAILSPVGAVWNYIRQNYPAIELYSPDESHPSVAGTYAAACSFYVSLFRKDPVGITFNSTLSSTEAADIRNAAKIVVYDSLLKWNIGEFDPVADFSFSITGLTQVSFFNNSLNGATYLWDFGDGNFSTDINPVHDYLTGGTYTVTLIANRCGLTDTSIQNLNVVTGINENNYFGVSNIIVFPNPAIEYLILENEDVQGWNYKIFNLLGMEVQNGSLYDAPYKIGLSGIPKGIYVAQLYDKSGRFYNHIFAKADF